MSIEPKWAQQNPSRQNDFSAPNKEPKPHSKINDFKQCFDPSAAPEKEKACSQIFQECMDFAKRYKRWHSSN